MQVNVYGGSCRQQTLVTDMAEWTGSKLLSSRMYPTITVTFHIKDMNRSHYGNATWLDENIRPKDFEINLDRSLRQRDLVESVAHEMVHVKQWATGQLLDYLTDNNLCRYNGVIYNRDQLDYYDYPWEIEAYGREVGLFIRWAEARGLAGERWTQRTK